MAEPSGTEVTDEQMTDNQVNLARIMQTMDQNYTKLFEQVISRMPQSGATSAEGSIMGSRWTDFQKTKPPTYSTSTEPLEADDWLLDVERKLDTVQCIDREKVLYASHQLTGPAAVWWVNYQAMHTDKSTITWKEFSEQFRKVHIPEGLIAVKMKEFRNLKQDGKSIIDYLNEFQRLARYSPDDVNTESKKMGWFVEGLDEPIKYKLAGLDYSNMTSLTDKVLLIEQRRKELEESRKRKAPQQIRPSSSNPRRKMAISAEPLRRFPPPRQNVGGNQNPRNKSTMVCFHCQQPNHVRPNCPWRILPKDVAVATAAGQQNVPRALPPNQNNPGRGARVPYRGGAVPNRGGSNGGAAVGRGRPIPAPNQGRVNHVSAQDAEGATDIILGMFPVNSEPALVLFDPGATHSFISLVLVKKRQLKLVALNNPHIIHAPGSDLKSQFKCPDIEIQIEGVLFEANLIVLVMQGLDVILGMDWLDKYKGRMDCENKIISLVNTVGKRAEFRAKRPFLSFTLKSAVYFTT